MPSQEEALADAEPAVLQQASFADAAVPGSGEGGGSMPVSEWSAAAAAAASRRRLTRQLSRAFETLVAMFTQRPVWLLECLEQQMGMDFTEETQLALLAPIAYRWQDGPWQTAFCRLGWDPRQNRDDAMWLQVLRFRDPALQRLGDIITDDKRDQHFRRPPVSKVQHYQLVDILDEFVQGFVACCSQELASECSPKCGWLEEHVLTAVSDRLAVKSQQMRERAATREAAAEEKQQRAREKQRQEQLRQRRLAREARAPKSRKTLGVGVKAKAAAARGGRLGGA